MEAVAVVISVIAMVFSLISFVLLTSFARHNGELVDYIAQNGLGEPEKKPVPKEGQLYYVKFIKGDELSYLNKTASGSLSLLGKEQSYDYQTKFTEQEIKAIDPRYWAFAMEVQD